MQFRFEVFSFIANLGQPSNLDNLFSILETNDRIKALFDWAEIHQSHFCLLSSSQKLTKED